MKNLTTLISSSLLFATVSFSQDSLNTVMVYRNAVGPCYSSITHGDTLIYGDGGFVVFSDITDINNPQEIARYETPCYVEDFALDYPNLFVADAGYGLIILDISDINNITTVGEIPQGTVEKEVEQLILTNDFLFALLQDTIQIINVSNVSVPQLVAELEGSPNRARFSITNDTLYQIRQDSTLVIWDVVNPQQPLELGSYKHSTPVNHVAVYQNYVYLKQNDDVYAIINTSTPDNPTFVGTFSGEYAGGRIFTYSGYLVLLPGGKFSMYDISSDPTNPTYIDHVDLIGSGNRNKIHFNNGLAFVSNAEFGVQIIDINPPENLGTLSYIESGAVCRRGFTYDHYAYINYKNNGLKIYDIVTPANPTLLNSFTLDGSNVDDMYFDYPYAYLAYGGNGLIILNISNPENLIQVGSYFDGDWVSAIHKKDNYIFQNSNDSLKIINVSDPTNPQEVSSIETGGFRKIDIEGNYAFLAQSSLGVKILDISDLNNITTVGQLEFDDDVRSVTVKGNYLYVSAFSDGLWIIDVSNPSSPNMLGHYLSEHKVEESRVNENLVYLSNRRAGVTILDVSDPLNPERIGYYNDPNSVMYIDLYENYIVVANISAGFYIARFDDPSVGTEVDFSAYPTEYRLAQNYPNPFNPTTTLRYDLPENSYVNVTVYNMLGREIRTLVNTTQDAGFKSVIWDATNDYGKPVSAGVYLYQIRSGEFVQTRKMVLLK